MALPNFNEYGQLPAGLHEASLGEVLSRFGQDSETRKGQADLLQQIVEAAVSYSTMKRVLVWGSFVTTKPEPNDLDYSVVVSNNHFWSNVTDAHRRFFFPFDARIHYGVDPGYLVVPDFPLARYVELVDFMGWTRDNLPCGIVEISLHGETTSEAI